MTAPEPAAAAPLLGDRLQAAIALAFEGQGEAWTDDHSGDRLARVAADAVEPLVAALVAEQKRVLRKEIAEAILAERTPSRDEDRAFRIAAKIAQGVS